MWKQHVAGGVDRHRWWQAAGAAAVKDHARLESFNGVAPGIAQQIGGGAGQHLVTLLGNTPVTQQGRPRSSNSVSPTMSEPIRVQPSAVGIGVSIANGAPTCAPFMKTMRLAGCTAYSASITSLR